ncbi:jg1175 [Pararge aegeria aegeria]|uniref:Jg1175 protein n=1 Tax=Pararge aegeria aegeria TaxID=348720 RepID=A0A8S4QW87_9NEOP|nr:jg1175 [Pararge aegeria aegeria]
MNYNQSKNSIIVGNTLDLPKTNRDNEESGKFSRRPLVLSSEDVAEMAVASSRARLMMELVKNPINISRDDELYLLSKENESIPAHAMTALAPSISKRIIPTYPTLIQNPRWKCSDETYSPHSQTELEEDQQFRCKCHKCKMKQCQNREDLQENIKSFTFKDNIMRFTDKSTMTPKLIDAYCEACRPLNRTPKTSDAYISTSDTDVRAAVSIQKTPTKPAPILKKRQCDNCFSYHKYNDEKNVCSSVVSYDEAVRDTHKYNDYEKLLSYMPKREIADSLCHINRGNARVDETFRKNLYNEGISDSIADTTISKFSGCSTRLQPPTKCPIKDFSRFHGSIRPSIKRDYSKVSYKCDVEKKSVVPFAHRVQSKYHYGCKKSVKKVDFQYEECVRHEAAVSNETKCRIPRLAQVSRVLLCDRPKSKLPKKLLTSERDIDSFVGNRRVNLIRKSSNPKLFNLFSSC